MGAIFLAGWMVLVGAVAMNLAAGVLGVSTWYDFLKAGGELGWGKAVQQVSWISWVFLLGLYPLGLGALAAAGLRLARGG